MVNGAKVGGNVASYFCLSDGTVVHAVAGPLDAQQFLREAKWAADVRKLAVTEAGGDVAKYRLTVRKAHVERLEAEHGYTPTDLPSVAAAPPVPTKAALESLQVRQSIRQPVLRRDRTKGTVRVVKSLDNQGLVHALLAHYPLPKLATLYPIVFEDILRERVSTLPVQSR